MDATGLLLFLKDSMFIIAMFLLHRLLGPIKIISEQSNHLRNENGVDMNGSIRRRRPKTIPSRFKDCLIMTSVGHRDYSSNEENLRLTMFFSNN